MACVGPLVAKDIVMTGRRIEAAEMARLGLMNRVVPASEVVPSAMESARSLAAFDREAMGTVKARANAGLVEIWERALR